MATLNGAKFALNGPTPAHGDYTSTNHQHDTVTIAAGQLTTGDTYQFGYLPPNAVVTGCILKAATQLDSNGSPTLAFNVGISGTASLFKAAITTVGRAAASADNTVAAAGMLYKNTTGSKVLLTAAPSTGAATGVAGTLELVVSYFVEE